MKKLSKSERIRKMLISDFTVAQIAKTVKVSPSYVYNVQSKARGKNKIKMETPIPDFIALKTEPEPAVRGYGDMQNTIDPDHYKGSGGGYEVWDFIVAHGLDYLRGNVVKYLVRAGIKSYDTELEDLYKAKAYLEREIKRAEAEAEAEGV